MTPVEGPNCSIKYEKEVGDLRRDIQVKTQTPLPTVRISMLLLPFDFFVHKIGSIVQQTTITYEFSTSRF